MSTSYLINVNTNRVKEGARVLEDIARFVLRDETLFKKIRDLRHGLQITQPMNNVKLDFGGIPFKEDNIRGNLIHLVQANSSRIQEALRVLEEISQDGGHKQKIKSLRYTAYHLQQEFYKRTMQFINQDKLKGLYPIIDADIINLPIETMTNIINQSSVNLIQFRSKSSSKQSFLQKAMKFKKLLDPNKLLIINDHLDIALDIAEGVHLGQQDYPLERVRKLLPDNFVFGVTCHNMEEAKRAMNIGASYLSVGCMFPTQSKKKTVRTSLSELEKIQQFIHLPVCAVGGIHLQNIEIILSCKVKMIAVISSIWHELNPALAIETMQKQILSKSEEKTI